ncbi:MAG: hypothetical protein PGN13_03115 [Patulibacter minatonensis]
MSVLFRGEVDAAAAQSLLDANGSGDLRLIDNGFVGGLPTDGSRLHSGDPIGLGSGARQRAPQLPTWRPSP